MQLCCCVWSFWRRQRHESEREKRKRPERWRERRQLSRACWSRPRPPWSLIPHGKRYGLESVGVTSSHHFWWHASHLVCFLKILCTLIAAYIMCCCVSGKREIPKGACFRGHHSGVGEEEDIQRFYACTRGNVLKIILKCFSSFTCKWSKWLWLSVLKV